MQVADPIAHPSRVPDRTERVGSPSRTYWTERTNEERDEKLISYLSYRNACARTAEPLRRLALAAGLELGEGL